MLHPSNTLGKNVVNWKKLSTEKLFLLTIEAPNRVGFHSRQASSNSGEGNNRESSLDDSGVVDDHEPEGDVTSEDATAHIVPTVRVSF